MKLIIAGSRTIQLDSVHIDQLIHCFNCYPNEIVSGTAKGIDLSGEHYTKWSNEKYSDYKITLTKFPAKWENEDGEFDKAAGHKRNKEMAEYADALLLIWDGESNGSKNMLKEMKLLKKPVYEVILRKHNA